MKDLSQLSDTTFLDDIVLSHCVSSPSKIAIKFNNKNITYKELGLAVAGLAQQLTDKGVKKGDFVAVLLEPSEHIIYSLLALSRIGAIYTPLDPTHPEKQITEKYQNTNAVCTITQQKHTNRVQHWASQTITIDSLDGLTEIEVPHLIVQPRNIDDPACIFFTSGTTGKAKGVLGSARAMRNAIIGPVQSLGLTNNDTLNSIARYAWSISMLELIAPLVNAGTSLILDPKQALGLDWLKTQVETCSAFHCPPALLKKFTQHILKNYPNNKSFDAIRVVWYGGDTFSSSHIDALQHVFPKAKIASAYGCTEIFGLSHIYFYPRDKTKTVLIGQPVQGIEQCICDENYSPIDAGEQGEIVLLGERLAEYWQAPELNAEKFIAIQGKKAFLTGDYALLHESGDLEFLQRKDDQVKIRGIRIELGEIEHILNSLDTVQEAVVLAVDAKTENRELRAYIVSNNNEVNTENLKIAIKQNLPDYMMPAQWYFLESLPVTENFKVDRKALSELQKKNTESVSFDGVTGQIAEVWTEITKSTPSSINDNFFESGGDSLAAIQLAVKLSLLFKTKIEVADVYRNPTLSGQVNIISKEVSSVDIASIKEVENSPPGRVYATQGQVGLFFREMFGRSGYSITCTRHIFTQYLYNEEWVKQALKVLIDRYPTLKTNIKVSRPHLELVENTYSHSDITFIRLEKGWSLSEGSELPLVKHMHKFDISKSPLICAIVSPLKEGGEMLQLTSHHIACDDNSLGRVAKEFVTLYDSYKTNTEASLVPATDNYSEFAQKQFNDIAYGTYSDRAKIAAQQLLEMLPQCKNNPLLEDIDNVKLLANHFERPLSIELSNAVFSHYIAALSWASYQIWDRTEFVFCAHSAMRRDSDSSPTVGMYINLLPVITGYNPEHDVQQHMHRSSLDFNDAMARSNIPYEVILDENDSLKKNKKFPFDAFINELSFVEKFLPDYKNAIVQEAFATNTNEMNITIVETFDGKVLHIESPSVDNIDNIHDQVFTKMNEFLSQIDDAR